VSVSHLTKANPESIPHLYLAAKTFKKSMSNSAHMKEELQ